MPMLADNTDLKRKKLATAVTWGLGITGAVVVSPIIFLAVKGAVGVALAGTLGLAIVNFAPVVAMKFANWKIKAIKAEAKANPIETLQNLLIEKEKAFEDFKVSVSAAKTAQKDFEDKVVQFKQKYPARAAEFEAQVVAMRGLVEKKVRALKDAQQAIKVGYDKLDEMKAYWEMSQAAQRANAAANLDTGDMYEKLKVDTACDAVFESMNKAFAEVEIAAALDAPAVETAPLQLADKTGDTFDAPVIKMSELQRIEVKR